MLFCVKECYEMLMRVNKHDVFMISHDVIDGSSALCYSVLIRVSMCYSVLLRVTVC